uniref:Juvenile hormone binding protein n=1 Tax=Riptortus pedestris TaxID=329032 RepID=R4WDY7_RIPPE|nr:unknown secreted protein [Riptortus pedestris]
MKTAFALFILIVGTSALPIHADEPLLKNGIEKLIKEVIEYFRWLLQRHDPYTPPAITGQHIVDKNIDIEISLSDVAVSEETKFAIDNVYFNLPYLKSTFQVTEPAAHVEGKFQVSGTVLSKQLKGSGSFVVDIENFVQKGSIQYEIIDHNLQIKTIDLDYEVSGAKGSVEGLEIDGMTADEVKQFFDSGLVKFLEEHKTAVSQIAGNKIKELANEFLIGKTLNFMKELIYSTPDPPPFPFIRE